MALSSAFCCTLLSLWAHPQADDKCMRGGEAHIEQTGLAEDGTAVEEGPACINTVVQH